MKKHLTVNEAKQIVQTLKGQKVSIKLNKGRNRICKCKGIVAEVHPNVFVLQLYDDILDRISCSYVDLICGEVCLSAQTQ